MTTESIRNRRTKAQHKLQPEPASVPEGGGLAPTWFPNGVGGPFYSYDTGERVEYLTDAPTDGATYGRHNASWVQISSSTGSVTATTVTINNPTGPALYIAATSGDWPSIITESGPLSNQAGYWEGRKQGKTRWSQEFGGTDAENGGNSGTNFLVRPWNDDGSPQQNGLYLSRVGGLQWQPVAVAAGVTPDYIALTGAAADASSASIAGASVYINAGSGPNAGRLQFVAGNASGASNKGGDVVLNAGNGNGTGGGGGNVTLTAGTGAGTRGVVNFNNASGGQIFQVSTPVALTSPIQLQQSGTGGFQFTNATGTPNALIVTPGANATTAAVLSASVPGYGVAIAGSNGGTQPLAGQVGEHLFSYTNTGSATNLTTGVIANCGLINLTAGDWDVQGCFFIGGTATSISGVRGWIHTVSATDPGTPNNGAYVVGPASVVSGQNFPMGQYRTVIGSTTSHYMSVIATFSGGTCTAYGALTARRRR